MDNSLNVTSGSPRAIRSAGAALPEGDPPAQEWALRAHLLKNPSDAVALARLGQLVREQGRAGEAVQIFRRSLDCAPDQHLVRLLLAQSMYQEGDIEAALEQVKLIGPPIRSSFEVRTFEAGLLGILGRHEPQTVIYQKLLREHPRDGGLWMRLGTALKYTGQTRLAIKALHRAVEVQPNFGEGWWSLANMKTFRFEASDIAAMRKALGGKLNPGDAFHLHFALGKALEERNEFEASFEHYAMGNRIRAEGFSPEQMDAGRVAREVDNAIATFDKPLFDRVGNAGHPARDPIFIVGLQRSGSTLIEQILASHPLIEGTSELDAMMHIWVGLDRAAQGAGRTVWEAIQDFDPKQLSDIGADYLERTRPFRTTDRPFFVDKRPANWMYVGLIRLVLPNATIIDARRHPMACGFSNFKQHYTGGATFAYSLETIGRYYADYQRLLDHFDRVQPTSVHHILNEVLIDDPEGEIRRLLDFVGVPFDAACLDFHRNKREVRTPSAEQVRRAINRDGVDQWRNYESWLGPLKEALGTALDTWADIPNAAR